MTSSSSAVVDPSSNDVATASTSNENESDDIEPGEKPDNNNFNYKKKDNGDGEDGMERRRAHRDEDGINDDDKEDHEERTPSSTTGAGATTSSSLFRHLEIKSHLSDVSAPFAAEDDDGLEIQEGVVVEEHGGDEGQEEGVGHGRRGGVLRGRKGWIGLSPHGEDEDGDADEDDDDGTAARARRCCRCCGTGQGSRRGRNARPNDALRTIAGVAGNILEWYDFAVFGFLSDVIGDVFFPPDQKGDASIVESFAVFGGAFLMRPIGGVLMGYIGDTRGRKTALTLSIYLMAIPTFAMGCLPSYAAVGPLSIVLLTLVRLLQGLSVGGQLMSSLVYTVESHPKERWGLYGSYVMAAANVGTLIGGIAGYVLRETLNKQQLETWGWRIPFLSGVLVGLSGLYLQHTDDGDEKGVGVGMGHVIDHHPPVVGGNGHCEDGSGANRGGGLLRDHHEEDDGVTSRSRTHPPATTARVNPVKEAFRKENRRSLLASALVPMLWAGGFYLTFVWMAIYMADLVDPPVPGSFGVNCASLLVSVCFFFPFAGMLSDRYGRIPTMTVGGVTVATIAPLAVMIIGAGRPFPAFLAQTALGVALSLWGASMMAWLVESFDPAARLTSVSIGYNLAQACVGGMSPTIATLMVDGWGKNSPGFFLTFLACLALFGLRCVSPKTLHDEDDAVLEGDDGVLFGDAHDDSVAGETAEEKDLPIDHHELT